MWNMSVCRKSLKIKFLYISREYTVNRFVWVIARFGTCTFVSVNLTLVEDKMLWFQGECAHFSCNKCLIYTLDGASAKFSTNSHDTDNSVEEQTNLILGKVCSKQHGCLLNRQCHARFSNSDFFTIQLHIYSAKMNLLILMKLSLSSVTDTGELGLAITATTKQNTEKNVEVSQANKPGDNIWRWFKQKNRGWKSRGTIPLDCC